MTVNTAELEERIHKNRSEREQMKHDIAKLILKKHKSYIPTSVLKDIRIYTRDLRVLISNINKREDYMGLTHSLHIVNDYLQNLSKNDCAEPHREEIDELSNTVDELHAKYKLEGDFETPVRKAKPIEYRNSFPAI